MARDLTKNWASLNLEKDVKSGSTITEEGLCVGRELTTAGNEVVRVTTGGATGESFIGFSQLDNETITTTVEMETKTVPASGTLQVSLDHDNVEEGESDMADIATINQIEKRLDKLEKDMSWWNADENESKVGNLKVQVDEMEKKLNMVVAIAKKLKGHMENREIHLQD